MLLFLIKTGDLQKFFSKFSNKTTYSSGLTYNGSMTVADLVNKDLASDGIPDWEKILLGIDPNNPDSSAIAKLQAEQEASAGTQTDNPQNLTETDNFSREFLATVASLDESGAIDSNGNMDQATADQLTNSLESNVQNSPQRKIYTMADIQVINDDSIKAITKYNTALNNLSPKNPLKYSVADVLQKFAPDDTGNNADPSVLPQLNPIITQMTTFLNGMIATPVPDSLATLHLNVINSMEGIIENLNDIQLYDTDPIVAFSGMTKYQQNSVTLQSALQALATVIDNKLKS